MSKRRYRRWLSISEDDFSSYQKTFSACQAGCFWAVARFGFGASVLAPTQPARSNVLMSVDRGTLKVRHIEALLAPRRGRR